MMCMRLSWDGHKLACRRFSRAQVLSIHLKNCLDYQDTANYFVTKLVYWFNYGKFKSDITNL